MNFELSFKYDLFDFKMHRILSYFLVSAHTLIVLQCPENRVMTSLHKFYRSIGCNANLVIQEILPLYKCS